MKQLYSPGPWKIARRKAAHPFVDRCTWYIKDAGKSLVCRVSSDDAVISCANARLIGSAPELLEFVAEMARFIRQEKEDLEVAGFGPPMSSYLEQAETLMRNASLPAATLSEVPGYEERI